MKTADIFILKSGHENETSFHEETSYYNVNDIYKQSESLKLSCSINSVDINEVPRSTEAAIVIFLHNNCMIPGNYLSRVLSLKTLHPEASGFFSDVNARITRCSREVSEFYEYFYRKINFDSNTLSYKCNTVEELRSLHGLVIDGRTYNAVGGYTPYKIKSKSYYYNHAFFSSLLSYSSFIYSSSLKTVVNINNSSNSHLDYEDAGVEFAQKNLNQEVFQYTYPNIYNNVYFQYGIFTAKTKGAFIQ
jgi:hypothetical protein